MLNYLACGIAAIVVSVVPTVAVSQPLTVIFDAGNTLAIDPYIKVKGSTNPPSNSKGLANPINTAIKYPVTTPSMHPGTIEPRAVAIPHFQTPLFIVGNDALSKRWLVSRLDELKTLNAIGLLVEADSTEDLAAIRALANGLRIEVVSGEGVAEQLDLETYPVLISKTGIEQ